MCFAVAATAWAATELRVGNVFAVPGVTALVSVRCTTDTPIVAAQFDLVFGSTNVSAGDATLGPALTGHEITSGTPAADRRRIVLHSPTNAMLGSGVWAYVPLSLATNTSYGTITLTLINVVLANHDGLPVTDCSVVSGSLTCTPGPVILAQPLSQVALVGSNLVLLVTAAAADEATYQWRRNGTNIAGAQGAILSLPGVAVADSGRYDVVLSNAFGGVTSQVARVSIFDPTKTWTGNGDGISWTEGNNWSGGTVPTSGDSVFIGLGTNAINYPGGTLSNMVCQRRLNVSGSTTINGGVLLASGNYYFTPGDYTTGIALTANGTNANFHDQGTVSMTAISLYAQNGGMLSLKALTNYSGGVVTLGTSMQAVGVGSVLDLPGLQTVYGPNYASCYLTLQASQGGRLDLKNVAAMSCQYNNYGGNTAACGIVVSADGTNSVVDLSGLRTFTGSSGGAIGDSYMQPSNGGQILATNLAYAEGLSLYASGGMTFSLPALTNYFSGSYPVSCIIRASGMGSVVDLPALQTVSGPSYASSYLTLQASQGGKLNLINVANMRCEYRNYGGNTAACGIVVSADGTNSVVDLSGLKTFTGSGSGAVGDSWMHSRNGGQILVANMYKSMGICLNTFGGSSFCLPSLTNVVGTPSVSTILRATGVGSVLVVTNLIAFTGPGSLLQQDGGIVLTNPSSFYQSVSIQLAPAILMQPQGGVVFAGSNFTFTVTALGNAPLRYQWFLNRTNAVTGATNATCFIPRSSRLDEGSYTVVITNGHGSITSVPAALVVAPQFEVATLGRGTVIYSPANYSVGGAVTLYATNAGRWYRFLKWNDGETNPVRTVFISASNNRYTAIFTNNVQLERWVFKEWERVYGGTNDEMAYVLERTSDGGFLMGGVSASGANGDKSSPNFSSPPDGTNDVWILKLDSRGIKQWDRSFGGNGDDTLRSAHQTADGGFILAAFSNSTNNSATAHYGLTDYWVIKTDGLGAQQWDVVLGGGASDLLFDVQETRDGGYLACGYSDSPLGVMKTAANFGGADIWLVKLGGSGEKVWDKALGGGANDFVRVMRPNPVGGFLIGGTSASLPASGATGTKTSTNLGSGDFWISAVDEDGMPVWDRVFGGQGTDSFFAMEVTFDGGLIMGGSIKTNDLGEATLTSFGSDDYYGVKADQRGNVIWQQAFGGDDYDSIRCVRETSDGGYLIGGWSKSQAGIGKRSPNYGGSDYWLIRLDAEGNWLWEMALGGPNDDYLTCTSIIETPDHGFAVGGYSYSGITSATNGNKTTACIGGSDFWLVKIGEVEIPAGTPRLYVNGQATVGGSFSLPGTNGAQFQVELSTSFANGFIFYTLDGTPPDSGSQFYDGTPLVFTKDTVLHAVAYDESFSKDRVADAVTLMFTPVYSLTVGTPGGGMTGALPAPLATNGLYLSNAVVTLTATPSNGWTFLYWAGDVSSPHNPQPVTLTRPLAVQAIFGTALTNTITPAGYGSVLREPDFALYPFGSDVRFSALPAAGKYFNRWTGAGTGFSNSPLNFTVTVPNTNCSALFSSLSGNNRSLTVLVTGQGNVMNTPQLAYYTNGQSVRLQATPESGWRFDGWTGDASGSVSQLDVAMNRNKVITANFVPDGGEPFVVVTMTNPPPDSVFIEGAPVPLGVQVTDPIGCVTNVAYYSQAGVVATSSFPPYAAIWANAPPGSNTLVAYAVGTLGNLATSAPPVAVYINARPVPALTQPTPGAVFVAPTNLTLQCIATDANGISRVEFLANSTNLIGVVTNPPTGFPITLVWSDVPPGTYELSVRATDSLGASGVSPVKVKITVNPPYVQPTLRFGSSSYEVEEDEGYVTLVVVKDGTGPASVSFLTENGTALYTGDGLGDYSRTSGSLFFGSTDTVQTITVLIGDDCFAEPAEYFFVRLTDPGPGVELSVPSNALVTIRASDPGADTNSLLQVRLVPAIETNRLGSLQVYLTGAGGLGQWRFDWDSFWRNSGTTAAGLELGNWDVAYRALPNWEPPDAQTIPVPTSTPRVITNGYTGGATGSGTLRVYLEPATFAASFGWRVAGESVWRASGATGTVPPGLHVVEYKPASGWSAPAPRLALVFENGETVLASSYRVAPNPPPLGVVLPVPVASVNEMESGMNLDQPIRRPFVFNGQLRSAAGFGSGCLVRERVVLTAA
ncbi:MAG TPA: Ig-like domain-containing protein, partial [Verrucomicrobiae bacterium]